MGRQQSYAAVARQYAQAVVAGEIQAISYAENGFPLHPRTAQTPPQRVNIYRPRIAVMD